MTAEPLAIGAVGDVATSSLLWRYGGQLHMCVAVRARYLLVDDGVATRAPLACAALAPADDRVPYRQGCDVWLVGECRAKPLSPTAPMTTHVSLFGGREQLLDKQHRLMLGSDLGVAGYGPRRTSKWIEDLMDGGVVEIPQNFDWTKLHAAVPNQRVRYLEGNERLVIENVLADRSKMRCRIPPAQGEARIWGRGASAGDPGYPIHLLADTLGIDADSGSMTVVWRGSFPIDDLTASSRMMIAAGVSEGAPIDWEEGRVIASSAGVGSRPVVGGTLDMPPGAEIAGASMPFSPERPSQPQGEALRPAAIEGAPWSERGGDYRTPPPHRPRAMTMEIEEGFSVDDDSALPFQSADTPDGPDTSSLLDETTQPVFEIVSNDTVETPPEPPGDGAATPFESSDAWPVGTDD